MIFLLMFSYRKLCKAMVVFFALCSTGIQASTPSPIAALDLLIAETLIEIGVSPVVVKQLSSLNFWTGNTYISSNMIEVGLPGPNMELLQQVLPSMILLAPWQTNQEARLSSVAPVNVVDNYPYTAEGDVWDRLLSFTYELGELAEQQQQASHLVQETQARLAILREHVAKDCEPLLFIQLLDERHIRVFGDNSFVHAVSQQLGLCNAWKGATNQWGYAQVGVENLFNTEARLVIIRSYNSDGLEEQIARTALWRYLPSVRRGDVIVLPSTFWIAGGLPSALRFAESLVEALETPPEP
ncbi:ABC transporter substrate-binding protein [Halomonas sp. SpR8]|uniref:ABC transporter substrate-binding protein n=1 Tax=Halomonas sp. SpR8 TaxID=3050463 RepID=UPI0027E49336|nr:ABC transporter substrate-binding protein [Halomonas sp. SpR8]MDQ7727768.1 ABC transporter substrate-binding protein [Halomonas sp. SpR8]